MGKRNRLSFLLEGKQKLITDYFSQEPQPPTVGQSSPQPEQASQQLAQPQGPQGIEQPQPAQPQSSAVGQSSPQPAQPQDGQLPQPPQLEQSSQDGQGQGSPQQASTLQDIHPSQPAAEQGVRVERIVLQPLTRTQLINALQLQGIVPFKGAERLKVKQYISRRVGCPRCGSPGRMYVTKRGKREYIYVKHRDRDCYVGPVGSYVVVQKVLGHLALKGLDSINYAEVVASAAEKLVEQIEKAMEENDKRRIEEIIDAMTDIAYVIRDACHAAGERRPHCLEEVARALFS